MSHYPSFTSTLNIDQKDCYSIPQVLLGTQIQVGMLILVFAVVICLLAIDAQANPLKDKYNSKEDMADEDIDIDNDGISILRLLPLDCS